MTSLSVAERVPPVILIARFEIDYSKATFKLITNSNVLEIHLTKYKIILYNINNSFSTSYSNSLLVLEQFILLLLLIKLLKIVIVTGDNHNFE